MPARSSGASADERGRLGPSLVDHERAGQPVAQAPRQRIDRHEGDAEHQVQIAHQVAGEKSARARGPPLGRDHPELDRLLADGLAAAHDLGDGEVPPVEQKEAHDQGRDRPGPCIGQGESPEDEPGEREKPQEEIVEERGKRTAAHPRDGELEADVVQPQNALTVVQSFPCHAGPSSSLWRGRAGVNAKGAGGAKRALFESAPCPAVGSRRIRQRRARQLDRDLCRIVGRRRRSSRG